MVPPKIFVPAVAQKDLMTEQSLASPNVVSAEKKC
jgi:hypothetical protein